MITQRTNLLRLTALIGAACLVASSGAATAATKKKVAPKKGTPTTVAVTAATTAATTAPTPAPAKAVKIVEIQNGSEPASWDPTKLNASAGAHANRMYPVFGALITMDPKSKNLRPLLADALSTTDGINWTLKIHKGLKFTDGTAFDAAAVKANWDRHVDPANASPSRAFAVQMASTTVVDPLTLGIVLVARNFQYPWGLQRSDLNYIGSPAALSTPAFATNPVGAGPFKVKEFKRDDRTVLTANADWPFWPGGKPNIDELTIKPVIDENQRYNNIATGQADLVFTQFAQTAVKAKKDGRIATYTAQEGGNTIIFNTTKPPFDDANVRRALQLAIDLKAFKAVNSPGDDNPITNVFDDDSPFVDKTNDLPAYNLPEAQRLIDD